MATRASVEDGVDAKTVEGSLQEGELGLMDSQEEDVRVKTQEGMPPSSEKDYIESTWREDSDTSSDSSDSVSQDIAKLDEGFVNNTLEDKTIQQNSITPNVVEEIAIRKADTLSTEQENGTQENENTEEEIGIEGAENVSQLEEIAFQNPDTVAQEEEITIGNLDNAAQVGKNEIGNTVNAAQLEENEILNTDSAPQLEENEIENTVNAPQLEENGIEDTDNMAQVEGNVIENVGNAAVVEEVEVSGRDVGNLLENVEDRIQCGSDFKVISEHPDNVTQVEDIEIEGNEGEVEVISGRDAASLMENEEDRVQGGNNFKKVMEQEEKIDEDRNCVRSNEKEIEAEECYGPSSSGYTGERGSSSPTSAMSSQLQEDKEAVQDNGNGFHRQRPGKRHSNEDDASISWRKRKKHFFVLSHSGKPIYSRHGDEHRLAAFSATLQAIISFVENGEDRLRFIRAGNHQIVFLVKGPVYLVCISSTEESLQSLKEQLELLYAQMLLILTKSIDRCFERDSKFDMTTLLGGTDMVFSSLIHAFSWNPATYLHAYTCLPLRCSTRQAASAILQDVADSGVLFAILMCKHKVISLVGAHQASLHPDDMLLLSNFVLSLESFRTSESFSPVCLPHYNAMAFLYAYVHYLEEDTFLMLLTTDSHAFFQLKDCRMLVENVLVKSNVLSEVKRSIYQGGLHVEDLPGDLTFPLDSTSFPLQEDESINAAGCSLETGRDHAKIGGPAGLWHFMYRSVSLDQYVSSEFSLPLSDHHAQKRLFRAYQNLYVLMHDKDTGPHKMQYRKDSDYVLLCWITQDFELYAAFDPLAEKSSAIAVCNRVCQWIQDMESELFIVGASSFAW